jgi:hypothetical protein
MCRFLEPGVMGFMSYWASSAYVDMPAAHPVAILITELWGKLAKRDTTLHLSQMHFAGWEPLETAGADCTALSISVLKLFTPQITGKITGSILAGRGQVSALGGGGRERPSGREPPSAKLLRLYQTAQGSVSDRPARVGRRPQKNGINFPQNQRLTYECRDFSARAPSRPRSQPPRGRSGNRRPQPPPVSGPVSSARRESVVLPELVSANRPQDSGVRTSPGRQHTVSAETPKPIHRLRGLCSSRWVCAFRESPAIT